MTAWQRRRLDELELDYLFLDASFFRYHVGAAAEPVLAAWGITTAGKSVFVGLATSSAEYTDAWQAFLTDLGERWLRCPLMVISDGAAGLHALRFRYQDGGNELAFVNDTYEGTKVGGHPVVLTMLISGAGVVQGLRVETDPAARLNRRKKAHLLGALAKARYGEDGWACTGTPPAAGEEPVGGLFVNERCEKATPTRRYVVSRQMFRRVGADQRGFVSAAQLEIRGLK